MKCFSLKCEIVIDFLKRRQPFRTPAEAVGPILFFCAQRQLPQAGTRHRKWDLFYTTNVLLLHPPYCVRDYRISLFYVLRRKPKPRSEQWTPCLVSKLEPLCHCALGFPHLPITTRASESLLMVKGDHLHSLLCVWVFCQHVCWGTLFVPVEADRGHQIH